MEGKGLLGRWAADAAADGHVDTAAVVSQGTMGASLAGMRPADRPESAASRGPNAIPGNRVAELIKVALGHTK